MNRSPVDPDDFWGIFWLVVCTVMTCALLTFGASVAVLGW